MKKYLILISFLSAPLFAAEPQFATTPGPAPENAKIEFVSATQARITWTDTSTNEDSMEIWISKTHNMPFRTLAANTTHYDLPVVPGLPLSWAVCSRFEAKSVCTPFQDSVVPRAVGSLGGKIVDQNFQPIANTTLKIAGLKRLVIKDSMWVLEEEGPDYSSFGETIIKVPDHIGVSDKDAAFYVRINSCGEYSRVIVKQNGVLRKEQGVLTNLADSAGVWEITAYSDDDYEECEAEVHLVFSTESDISFSFTTDAFGNYEVNNMPLVGTYQFEMDGMSCIFTANGETKLHLSSNLTSNVLCRPIEPPNR